MASQEKIDARRMQIIMAAENIFAQKGFQEATISEISKKAGVSDASIYEHFTTKEGLLFSIPVERTKVLFEVMEFHLKLIRGAGNKLRAVVYCLLSAYQKHPDFAAILMLILKHNRKFLETEGHKMIRKGIGNITKIVKEGIASGEFRSDLDLYLVRSIILGTIEHLVTNWIMTGKPEKLTDSADPLIDAVMEGILNSTVRESNLHWSMLKAPK